MPSFKTTFVAVVFLSLTLAAVAQTQSGSDGSPSTVVDPDQVELAKTIKELETRIASLERQLADRTGEIAGSLVRFGDFTGNLNCERHNRYLRMRLIFAVTPEHQDDAHEVIDSIRPKLQDWLISQMADKAIDDIRGADGLKKLRTEIKLGMNSVLKAEDHPEMISAILFTEFNVQ